MPLILLRSALSDLSSGMGCRDFLCFSSCTHFLGLCEAYLRGTASSVYDSILLSSMSIETGLSTLYITSIFAIIILENRTTYHPFPLSMYVYLLLFLLNYNISLYYYVYVCFSFIRSFK